MTHEKNFVARNIETGIIVANRVRVAATRAERAVGLLGRNHLEPGEGLWITPCHGVHTWFMRFSIDVLAMDEHGVIVDAVPVMKPWRMRLPRPGAHTVLELPAGTIVSAQMKVGQRLTIEGWDAAFAPALNYEHPLAAR